MAISPRRFLHKKGGEFGRLFFTNSQKCSCGIVVHSIPQEQDWESQKQGHLGPSWGRLGRYLGHHGPLLGYLGPSWAHLSPSWRYLGKKRTKNRAQKQFLGLPMSQTSHKSTKTKNSWPGLPKKRDGRAAVVPAGVSIRRPTL